MTPPPPPPEPAPVVAPAPTPPPAPPAPPPPPATTANKGKLTFKGFVSATLFAQDTTFTFGDGQNAEFPNPTRDKGTDPWFFDGDVRNTRLNLTWEGPTGTDLPKLGAVVEADFFGGTPGGGFGNAQAVPRLRIAAATMGIGDMTLKIGQDWSPLLGNIPVSLSHIAFPLGYGSAGTIGWRFPGIWLIVPLMGGKDAPLNVKLTLAVLRNSWPAAAALNPPNQGSSGIPQLQARLELDGKADTLTWSAYVVGSFDQKDISDDAGRGDTKAPGETLNGYGFEAGAKVTAAGFLVQANGYYGRAMGHEFGNLTQFGDISGFGIWGQVGYDFTPNWGVYVFYGMDDPTDDDLPAASMTVTPRLQNMQAAAMIRYKVGPYQLGLEYLWDQLKFRDTTGDTDVAGNQISLSTQYAF